VNILSQTEQRLNLAVVWAPGSVLIPEPDDEIAGSFEFR